MEQVVGSAKKIPVSCWAIVTHFGFIVVRNALFDASVGSPTLDSLQANLDYKRQQVTLVVWGKEVLLPLLGEPPVIDGIHTDNDDFTSPRETESEKFAASSSSESGSSKDGADSKQELVLAILNEEPNEHDL